MNILVTGGTGFIGSHACVALMETTAIADPDYLKNTQNPLCAPTAKALADTIARQFEHPADAPLPAEILWKALQTTLARALNGIVVKQE